MTILNLDEFCTWLKSKDENEVVGEALVCGYCPLANYLLDKGNSEVEVYSNRTYAYPVAAGSWIDNPDWVKKFVSKIDNNRQVGDTITVKDALEVVNNLYICTVCNQYNPEGTNCGKKDNCPW